MNRCKTSCECIFLPFNKINPGLFHIQIRTKKLTTETRKMIILSGPSGSGKTTIAKYLISEIPALRFAISATTRDKRDGEKEGVDYYFLTGEDFRNRLRKKEFVEHEEVYEGLLYGTLHSELEKSWQEGFVPVLDIDVKGALNVKRHYRDISLFIFVHPGNVEQLEKRLKNRGTESQASLQKRLNRAREELDYAPEFDLVVVNKKLDIAFRDVLEEVRAFLNEKE